MRTTVALEDEFAAESVVLCRIAREIRLGARGVKRVDRTMSATALFCVSSLHKSLTRNEIKPLSIEFVIPAKTTRKRESRAAGLALTPGPPLLRG
jgi:hypothetical protein